MRLLDFLDRYLVVVLLLATLAYSQVSQTSDDDAHSFCEVSFWVRLTDVMLLGVHMCAFPVCCGAFRFGLCHVIVLLAAVLLCSPSQRPMKSPRALHVFFLYNPILSTTVAVHFLRGRLH